VSRSRVVRERHSCTRCHENYHQQSRDTFNRNAPSTYRIILKRQIHKGGILEAPTLQHTHPSRSVSAARRVAKRRYTQPPLHAARRARQDIAATTHSTLPRTWFSRQKSGSPPRSARKTLMSNTIPAAMSLSSTTTHAYAYGRAAARVPARAGSFSCASQDGAPVAVDGVRRLLPFHTTLRSWRCCGTASAHEHAHERING
jgi:hypothetical protein